MQGLEQNNTPPDTLSVDGNQVRIGTMVAENGYRFTLTLPSGAPHGLLRQIHQAAQQWCQELVGSHPDIVAKSWTDFSAHVGTHAVLVEAEGNTQTIGGFLGSLWDGITQSGTSDGGMAGVTTKGNTLEERELAGRVPA